MENMEFTKLRYPNLRDQLIDCLRSLSDRAYQRDAWVNRNLPLGQGDNFDLAIHVLFDDLGLEEDPRGAIGVFLYDEAEIVLISDLIEALNAIFDKYGTSLSDEDYIEKPEWKRVLETAKIAWSALLNNDAARIAR